MTEAEFRTLAAQGYNRIPLVLETFADLDTPLSLYVKLANEPFSFLLESVVGGERFGRYSFIGLPAQIRIRARGTAIEVDDRGAIVERHEGDPLAFVGQFLPAIAPRRGRASRVSAAGSPARSATTPCATSRESLRAARRRRDRDLPMYPTSCCS
jgi:anthranilate/para-aminobenzoate synthase component I